MPAFKFKLSQCVTVPTDTSVQGRVSARTEFVNQANIYQVVWLDAKLDVQSAVFSESELASHTVESNPSLPEVDFSSEPTSKVSRSGRRAKR